MRIPSVQARTIENIVIVAFILIGALIRAVAYGDLRLSVGNFETNSYVKSSRAPFFSWETFAGQRLFTTNLIYKLANDPNHCKLLARSDPTSGHGVRPLIQPCFSNIALLQNLLAIIAWCLLAWITARWMTAFPSRAGIAIVILVFGFTPQIAEWDSLLGPESLTVTALVALLAILEEIALGVALANDTLGSRRTRWLIAAALVVLFFWLFLRDAHLYAVPLTTALVALLFTSAELRRQRTLWVVLGSLAAMFVLGYTSAQASLRATHYPLAHSFEDYILPFPGRVAFFDRFGMPNPSTPAYQHWLDHNATSTYAAFLVTHPGFIIASLADHLDYFRAEFVQQYFEPPAPNNRSLMLQLGEVIHPETLAVYLIDVFCVAGLWLGTQKGSSPSLRGWAWLGSWLFLCSAIMLFVGFFGDAEGARRHIYPSVESLRLLMWLLLFVYIDQVLKRPESAIQGPASTQLSMP